MKALKRFLFCVFILLVMAPLTGEMFSSSYYGWTLDLPEGFSVKDAAPDGLSFYMEHEFMKARVAIQLYPEGRYERNDLAMEDVLNRLDADGEIDGFLWHGRKASISSYEFTLPGNQTRQSGWGLSVDLPSQKMQLVVLCYADSDVAEDSQQFILSALDSLCTQKEDFRRPGPVTSYAFNSSESEEVILNIQGKKIYTQIEKSASESGRFVIDREFSVLTLYANQRQWKEAWQRYYRLVFREAYSRFDRPASNIYKALYVDAVSGGKEGLNEALLKTLLAWTQGFSYSRRQDKSDFSDLASVLQDKGSDCDSRALLLCVLLEHYGIKTELFVSGVYSHALLGVDIPLKGAHIPVDGVDYLLCETTSQVAPGLVAQEQSEIKNWISVDLP